MQAFVKEKSAAWFEDEEGGYFVNWYGLDETRMIRRETIAEPGTHGLGESTRRAVSAGPLKEIPNNTP